MALEMLEMADVLNQKIFEHLQKKYKAIDDGIKMYLEYKNIDFGKDKHLFESVYKKSKNDDYYEQTICHKDIPIIFVKDILSKENVLSFIIEYLWVKE
jgi:hypothetical protein